MTNLIFPKALRKIIIGASLFSSICFYAEAYADTENPDYYSEILRLDAENPEADLNRMLEEGAILVGRRADIVLMLMPVINDNLPPYQHTNSGRKAGRRIPRRPKLSPVPTMDAALSASGVDRIVTGRDLPQSYDGTGVVVGFCDIGFDSRHINFRDKDDVCRISRVVRFVESEGRRECYSTPEEIFDFHTDDEEQTHATHVAGILAGSHEIFDTALIGPQHPRIASSRPGIRGIASGAEIVATMSELSEVGLLAGVEEIIAYAKEVGKPAVINMSVGNYNGPHDGSSLFCQYLDMCAEDAIIVLSAGNEGADTNHLRVKDASAEKPLIARIAGRDWVNLQLYGETDIYAVDSTPFNLTLRIKDSTKDDAPDIEYETAPINFMETPFVVISSQEQPGEEGWRYDEEFARHFQGEVYIEGGIDPENGRYRANIIYNCTTEELYSDAKRWAKYRIELMARPESPCLLDAFADGSYSWLANWTGNPNPPGHKLSISDLACGEKTISVGMYCTGKRVFTANGTEHSGEYDTPFTITKYSSYGELYDGRVLPLTVGPGTTIVSSMSGAYARWHDGECSHHITDEEGNVYSWTPMSGTSMSSPFVAGTIATWLQADPTLNWRDVQKIISDTNFYPAFAPEGTDPHYGAGLFDGFAGLTKVISRSGVTGTANSSVGVSAIISGEALCVLNPSGAPLTIDAYNLQGSLTYHKEFCGAPDLRIALDNLKAPGIPAIVKITNTVDPPLTLKLL